MNCWIEKPWAQKATTHHVNLHYIVSRKFSETRKIYREASTHKLPKINQRQKLNPQSIEVVWRPRLETEFVIDLSLFIFSNAKYPAILVRVDSPSRQDPTFCYFYSQFAPMSREACCLSLDVAWTCMWTTVWFVHNAIVRPLLYCLHRPSCSSKHCLVPVSNLHRSVLAAIQHTQKLRVSLPR